VAAASGGRLKPEI